MSSSKLEEQVTYQLTPRDIVCLTWIAMQYAIRLDQLQRLLFRYTPEQDRHKLKPGADRLSLDRTYELVSKWLSLGYIEKGGISARRQTLDLGVARGNASLQTPFHLQRQTGTWPGAASFFYQPGQARCRTKEAG